MGIGPSAEQQEAAEHQKQVELAQERVARRQKLGQPPAPEPILDEE